jgi:DNA invertase Pin-like site-specific DNA recombinase
MAQQQAIIYARFSPRPNADTCDSCEKQLEKCRQFCKLNGWAVYVESQERGVSGDNLASRPELQRAINCMKPGDILVVTANDRLARDVLAFLTIQQAVKDQGGEIRFADGTPSAVTPEGMLLNQILAAFAEYQRTVTKLKTSVGVKKALAKRKEAGLPQGAAPFGYKWESGAGIVQDAREQAILAYIRGSMPIGIGPQVLSDLAYSINNRFGKLRHKPATARSVRRIILTCLQRSNATVADEYASKLLDVCRILS